MNLETKILGLAILLGLVIAYLIVERISRRNEITTKTIVIGNFKVTIENGKLVITPK